MSLCFYFLLSYYYFTGGTLWHFQKYLQYILVKFTSPSFSFISPHTQNSFNRSHFSIFHIWTHNISTIFTLLHPFLISSPVPLVPTSIQDLFYLYSSLCLRYTMRFIMAFLCRYVLYSELVHPLQFCPFYLSSLLKVI
jgi:hypothetical protein